MTHAVLLSIVAWSALASAPERRIELSIVDAATDAPLPARVSIRGGDGVWRFPTAGPGGSVVRYERKAIGRPDIVEMHATVSAHPCFVSLPDGEHTIRVERGKEHHAKEVTIPIDERSTSIRIKLRRWIDMAALGWYSGDTHTHRTLDELPNVMRAEDLNIAFPLVDWVREAFVPPTKRRAAGFVDPGAAVVTVEPNRLIAPRNTEYEIFTVDGKSHTLGAFFVINHRSPLEIGAPPVAPVARLAKEQGALIELDKHNWPWSMAIVPIMPVDLFELSNNHVWETQFGFAKFGEDPAPEMKIERDARGFTERGWIDFGFKNYYALLNCGFSLRPTAGTASGVHPVPLGFGRVYVKLDGPLTADAWLAGLNEGNSFVTTGPMLFATLDGRRPGRAPRRSSTGETLRLAGHCAGGSPLSRIEVVVGGEVATTVRPVNKPTEAGGFESPFDVPIPIENSTWVVVRCFEPTSGGRERFAHSAPFHLEVPGRPLRPRKFEADYIVRRVEAQIERSKDVLPPAAVEEYRNALAIYRKIAETAR